MFKKLHIYLNETCESGRFITHRGDGLTEDSSHKAKNQEAAGT